MNSLTSDCIAIDTNVFMHLMNPSENSGGHITALLTVLANDGVQLAVDESGAIASEYLDHLEPIIKSTAETTTEIALLRHWMVHAKRQYVEVDRKGSLMKSIAAVICEPKEKVDRMLVAVVCILGRILVTNDKLHILWGPAPEKPTPKRNRSSRLRRETKKHADKGAEWISSLEAHDRL